MLSCAAATSLPSPGAAAAPAAKAAAAAKRSGEAAVARALIVLAGARVAQLEVAVGLKREGACTRGRQGRTWPLRLRKGMLRAVGLQAAWGIAGGCRG